VTNTTRRTVLAERAAVARGLAQRMAGLLTRAALAQGEALVIPGCGSIHTWFMRFPIDVVFLKSGRAVKLIHALRPFRLAWAPGADAVVELPAGTIARTATRLGEQLDIRESG
jgi:uncharacterized membrane protein (UPF0127 family)